MIYLTNPKATVKKARRRKKKASPAQMRARRKFAAMARARAKAARGRKRATRKVGLSMAKRRRTTAKKRRRVSARRRSPVTRLRRSSVYVTNPRRRRVRRYRRNPGMGRGILGQVGGLVQDSGAALVGAAVGRMVSNAIPIGGGQPITEFAKNVAVAIAIKTFGKRFLGERVSSYAAVGAMLGPTKDLIVSFVPQAGQFLGASSAPMYFPTMSTMNAYAGTMDEVMGGDVMEQMGSYSGDIYTQ